MIKPLLVGMAIGGVAFYLIQPKPYKPPFEVKPTSLAVGLPACENQHYKSMDSIELSNVVVTSKFFKLSQAEAANKFMHDTSGYGDVALCYQKVIRTGLSVVCLGFPVGLMSTPICNN